ncbi:hypothetical protein Trisim1_011188 [Trichoderma cf. simile WF8]
MQTTHTSATLTRVNLGPLTTTFSPPSDCASLRFITENEVFMGASLGYGCYDVQTQRVPCSPTSINILACRATNGDVITWMPCSSARTTSDKNHDCTVYLDPTARHDFSLIQSCYPSGFASSFGRTDDNIGKWTSQPLVYSPGLACPSGYLPQCTIERGEGLSNPVTTNTMAPADNAIWSMLNDGETAIGCCPSNYACDSNSPHICTSQPHAGDIIAITDGISCGGGAGTTKSIPSTALTAQAMKILLIQSSTPTSTPPTRETQLPSERFSKGAKIAVGVVVPIVVFLIGVALVYFLRRKKLQSTPDQEVSAGGDSSDTALKAELQGSTGIVTHGPKGATFEKPELGATGTVAELSAGSAIQELHGNSSVANLHGPIVPDPELQLPVGDIAAGEAKQQLGEHSSKQDPESTTTGLWDWSNFNTLGEPDESVRTSITGTRK